MKKKSLLLSMLTVITVFMLSVFFVSCGGDDEDVPIVNSETPNVDSQWQIYEYVFPGSFNLIYEKTAASGLGYVKVAWAHDAGGMLDNPQLIISADGANIRGVEIGKVSSITDIKKLPTEGWVSYLHFYDVNLYKGYIVEIYKDNKFRYYRLFISSFDQSASGEVVGVRIKYQQFNPNRV